MKRAVLWIAILAAVCAAVYTVVSGGPGPVHSFYETTAQGIPVLIVVLAVDSRALAIFEGLAPNYRRIMFGFLLIGESCALLAASGVFRGHSAQKFQEGAVAECSFLTNVLAAGTIAGLVGGFFMFAAFAVGEPDSLPEG